ncbi:hypothetical protein N5923_04800 [Erwiniaceae bacterium BAC15a-03b]|uniref:Uncharacterized protein n=1 Tax=Winslowiella arboricola TaxID=2978220 RepID=A0A9J6PK17_9GAMM|nr:hypothetical protein [Winslowiella arboricola]MCU5774248.1 hypothetical protein [Winslowiella arboricola]MCU5776819.1 hypothetical protein [Winslowiella arboricola]
MNVAKQWRKGQSGAALRRCFLPSSPGANGPQQGSTVPVVTPESTGKKQWNPGISYALLNLSGAKIRRKKAKKK